MFFGASSFNQPESIESWDIRRGTHFEEMFEGASAYTGIIPQPFETIPSKAVLLELINNYFDDPNWSTSDSALTYGAVMNQWDVSSITDFSNLFKGKILFDAPIGRWNVSQGTTFVSTIALPH